MVLLLADMKSYNEAHINMPEEKEELRNTASMQTTKMALTMYSGMEQLGFTFTKANKANNYWDI